MSLYVYSIEHESICIGILYLPTIFLFKNFINFIKTQFKSRLTAKLLFGGPKYKIKGNKELCLK